MRGQRLIIRDAIEDSFQEAVKDGKAAMKRKRPLQPDDDADVERLLGPETPVIDNTWTAQQEDEFLADWNENPLKAEFENIAPNNAHLAKLWKTSCAVMQCSPVSIISPQHSLTYNNPENDDDDDDDDEYHSQLWPRAFCDRLSTIISHPFWMGDPLKLVTAIQFAVVCRKGMRNSWVMPMAKTQNMDIEWLRETVSRPRLVGSTLQRLCLNHKKAILAESSIGPSIDFGFFCHLASLITAPTARGMQNQSINSKVQYDLQGSEDLKVLIEALDTLRHSSIMRIFPGTKCSQLVVRQCVSQKAIPAGNKIKEYHTRSFLHELRMSACNAALSTSSQEEEEEVRGSNRRTALSRRRPHGLLPVERLGRRHPVVVVDDDDGNQTNVSGVDSGRGDFNDDTDVDDIDSGHGYFNDDTNVDDIDSGRGEFEDEADSDSDVAMKDSENDPASRYASREELDSGDESIQEDPVNQSRSEDAAAARPGAQPRGTRASSGPLTPQPSAQPPADNGTTSGEALRLFNDEVERWRRNPSFSTSATLMDPRWLRNSARYPG